ncbi:hypothetical protein UFOVP546_14 [uncultured Caudovirales phage]|uniref:Uncharacterized protein n=1 Tax=uncultured Caudovirales phage TaxID=2100421 RepID=A0A6J5MUF6_9CAUD|nr:hypothetical protein UFOVP546_14 [uncultured Caudovirales phage]
MKTKYTKGFMAGVEYARNQVLEFLNAHHDLGDILTLEEVITEVEHWEIKDIETLRGLQDDRLALKYGVEESANICEECFGPDLCYVCQRP